MQKIIAFKELIKKRGNANPSFDFILVKTAVSIIIVNKNDESENSKVQ